MAFNGEYYNCLNCANLEFVKTPERNYLWCSLCEMYFVESVAWDYDCFSFAPNIEVGTDDLNAHFEWLREYDNKHVWNDCRNRLEKMLHDGELRWLEARTSERWDIIDRAEELFIERKYSLPSRDALIEQCVMDAYAEFLETLDKDYMERCEKLWRNREALDKAEQA